MSDFEIEKPSIDLSKFHKLPFPLYKKCKICGKNTAVTSTDGTDYICDPCAYEQARLNIYNDMDHNTVVGLECSSQHGKSSIGNMSTNRCQRPALYYSDATGGLCSNCMAILVHKLLGEKPVERKIDV